MSTLIPKYTKVTTANRTIAEKFAETYKEIDANGNEVIKTKPWGYYDRSVLAVTVMSLQKALATIESLTARLDEQQAQISVLQGAK